MPPEFPSPPAHLHSILQSIVVTAIDGIFLMDTAGTILMCNPAGGSLFGYRKHIGSRFFRASNVSHLQGTRLGLNIVSAYLDYLHGTLTFRSHGDAGTTFIITIPAQHEA